MPSPTTPTNRRGIILAVILVSQLMVVLDATIVNIALPDMRVALGFSQTGLSWVINAYTLTFGGLLLLGARAGDLLGRRRVFVAGIALFVLASLAGGLATSPGLLLGARAVQGVGGALASPSALALLMTTYTEARERTRAIGLYTAISIGGSAIGLIAGGLLTEYASWRWVFFVNIPVGAAVLLLARTLPRTARHTGRFDLTGALTSTIGMTGLVYGFVRAASDGWSDPGTIASLAGGLVLLAAFALVEMRSPQPITPLRLFADRDRSGSYVARLLLVAGMYGMFFFLTQFLQNVLHYSPVRAGVAFLPLTAILFLGSVLSAQVLTQRIPAKVLMVGGLLFSTAGLLWLTRLSASSSYPALLGPLLIFGLGNGLAFVPLTSASLRGVAAADSGAASGLVNATQQVGGALGLAVLVSVFGPADRSALAHIAAGTDPRIAAAHAFVTAADRSFGVSAAFLAATVILVALVMRNRSGATAAADPELLAEVDAA